MALPRGPLKTEFWHFVVVEKDLPQVAKDSLRIWSKNNGPTGIVEMDNLDNWIQMTGSGRTPMARKHRHQVSMGVSHAGPHPEYAGQVSERYISENNQRNFYGRWQEFLNAESWKAIPIEPITAKFEGTATLKG